MSECMSQKYYGYYFLFFQCYIFIFSRDKYFNNPSALFFSSFFIFPFNIAQEFRQSCQTTGVQVSYHKGKFNMIISCDFLHIHNVFCVRILS